jgi:glutamate formiminotransferase
VGSAQSGFGEVAAYPAGTRKETSSTLILELGDLKRSPLHRALAVIEIEAKRFGASLGLGALLSNAPLSLFADALKMHMGLAVERGQVIETHLPGAMAQK